MTLSPQEKELRKKRTQLTIIVVCVLVVAACLIVAGVAS